MTYVGRFAPSPTGPLHAGSLVAALASYLDAKAHQGRWLLRIEDIDEARCLPHLGAEMIADLAALGLHSDGEVLWQSQRKAHYQAAFEQLSQHTYLCACSRKEIADSRLSQAADGAAIYPGTCRQGMVANKPARSWRLRVPAATEAAGQIHFKDRWQGRGSEVLAESVGDFVLHRADGFWAYQLAVVVDDAQQGITHIVRGADLLDSTARQIYLQQLLGFPEPSYLHLPVLLNASGEKLSKQTGAQALDVQHPLRTLQQAGEFLGLTVEATSVSAWLVAAAEAWRQRLGGGVLAHSAQ